MWSILTNTWRVLRPERPRWRLGGPRRAGEDWSSSMSSSRSGGWADGRLRPGRTGRRLDPGRRAEGGDTPSAERASWRTSWCHLISMDYGEVRLTSSAVQETDRASPARGRRTSWCPDTPEPRASWHCWQHPGYHSSWISRRRPDRSSEEAAARGGPGSNPVSGREIQGDCTEWAIPGMEGRDLLIQCWYNQTLTWDSNVKLFL